MGGHYRLGPRLPATLGNMWDIIRFIVAADVGLSHSRLLGQMMAQDLGSWPEKVRKDPSKQGIGSELWCNGYINGAVRGGYLTRD